MACSMDIQMKPEHIKKIAILGIIIIIIILFKVFGLGHYFTLNYIKQQQANFAGLYAEKNALVIAVYMLIYITVTALSLPGAAVMTLAGGGMFGLVTGTIVVSFASTIGATLACIVARYLLRDWVQKKFGDKLTKINEGIEKEGGFYLFSLRLVPIFPFFIINLVMGLTPIRIITYFWVRAALPLLVRHKGDASSARRNRAWSTLERHAALRHRSEVLLFTPAAEQRFGKQNPEHVHHRRRRRRHQRINSGFSFRSHSSQRNLEERKTEGVDDGCGSEHQVLALRRAS